MRDELGRLRKCFQPRQWFFCDEDLDLSPNNDEVIFMWVYRPVDNGFQVGYFMPDRTTWVIDSTHADQETAARRVNYLNGGHVRERGEG